MRKEDKATLNHGEIHVHDYIYHTYYNLSYIEIGALSGFLKRISDEDFMDLIDRVKELSQKVGKQLEHIKTEEATKNAFIMPFIAALGYDIFNQL